MFCFFLVIVICLSESNKTSPFERTLASKYLYFQKNLTDSLGERKSCEVKVSLLVFGESLGEASIESKMAHTLNDSHKCIIYKCLWRKPRHSLVCVSKSLTVCQWIEVFCFFSYATTDLLFDFLFRTINEPVNGSDIFVYPPLIVFDVQREKLPQNFFKDNDEQPDLDSIVQREEISMNKKGGGLPFTGS